MTRSAALLIAAMVLFTTSCKDKTSQQSKIPLKPPADSIHQANALTPFKVQLDSGNAAYSAKDYARAREHYTRATEMDSTKAAAWFGVYMAEDKLGNHAAADYAMKRATQLNPEFQGANPHATPEKKENKT